jgi:hypothetical protein
MTSIRQRLIMAIAKASMKHGVFVRLDTSAIDVRYRTEVPEAPLSQKEREAVARKLLRQFDNRRWTSELFSTLLHLRRGNKSFEEREVAFAFMSGVTLETVRRDALVEMLNLGLDADPLFTEVASAESTRDVARAVAAAREQTTRRQELVAL